MPRLPAGRRLAGGAIDSPITHQYSYGSTAHDLSYTEHSLGVTTFSIRVWPGGPLRALLFICVLRCAFAPGDAANTKHGASLTSSEHRWLT